MKLGPLLAMHGSDKHRRHRYDRAYELFLQPYRTRDDVVLVEAGVGRGGSLRAWRAWLPRARIIGVDIDPRVTSHLDGLDVELRLDDATVPEFWQSPGLPAAYTVAIDDASHVAADQIAMHQIVWPLIEPGGLYVCEDLVCHSPATDYFAELAREQVVSRTRHYPPLVCFAGGAVFLQKSMP